MGLLDRFLNRDRKFWFVCYTCLQQTGHDVAQSVYYSEDPLLLILGRPLSRCPRCEGTNAKSFQQLKEEGVGSEAALWGLEQFVKKYPRSQFQVKKREAVSELETPPH